MTLFNQKPVKLAVATALTVFALSANAAPQAPVNPYQSDAINFSFAIKADAQLQTQQKAQTESNEYYFVVSGKQLNRGIDVHTTAPGALVKISRQGNGKSLDIKALNVVSKSAPGKNVVKNLVNEQELEAAGVFGKSTAVQLSKDAQPGVFKLSYNKVLSAKGQYLIHVKEKHAAEKLMLSGQKQNFVNGEKFSFDAAMMSNDKTLAFDKVSAYVLSPSGKRLTVAVDQLDSGVAQIGALQLADDAVESPRNGLYELYINADAKANGKMVRRTGKIAFALSPQTAQLGKLRTLGVSAKNPQADFSVKVKQAGRYEVRATLYGHDAKGNLKPIMETHSADNLSEGNQVINMQFDQKILAASGLKAPFVVQNVRLFDQSRLAKL